MADRTGFRSDSPGSQPDNNSPDYGSTRKRHPQHPALRIAHGITEATGPVFAAASFPPLHDLSVRDGMRAQGERIIVGGRLSDADGRALPNSMIELWQANAAGRYDHEGDQHDAPLDPHFRGAGRVFTDADGWYEFTTVKPGAYPWRNHANAWRPNHIHFSLFGPGFATRLVTQMYFPGDPLLALDPVFNAVPDVAARSRLVAQFDLALTRAQWGLGFRFDIVLRGAAATPMEGGA